MRRGLRAAVFGAVAFGALSATSSSVALDLTPLITDVTEDGSTYRQVSFKDGERKIVFAPPAGWSCAGEPGRFEFRPASSQFTQGVIESTSSIVPKAGDSAAVDAFKKQVLADLPAAAAEPAVVTEGANTLLIGGYPSYEVVLTYKLWGKLLERSVLLVKFEKQPLIFRFTAEKAEYAALLPGFRRSVMSLHSVEPKPAPKPEMLTEARGGPNSPQSPMVAAAAATPTSSP